MANPTTMRINVRPEMLRWARERARVDSDEALLRFPKLSDWENETARPTFRQLEAYAYAMHAPIGYFFLPTPPDEKVPIPDFRTFANAQISRPSPDLLDTLYLCQQRQEWYREYARSQREDMLAFVGSATTADNVVEVAEQIRLALGFDITRRRQCRTWEEALRLFLAQTDAVGVLVMVNGVVGSNTHRVLDPGEFRGFALSDEYAPLVFINGADTKSAQMFTLAHELAHIWLGQTALSDAESAPPTREIARQYVSLESWCNAVAAELLVPMDVFREFYPRDGEDLETAMKRLAQIFKVSTLVVLRRMYDAGGLAQDAYWLAYRDEVARLSTITNGQGGDFYRTLGARVGKRFERAIVISTLEGQTLHRDALRMLGISKQSTFYELSRKLGLA